MAKAKANTPGIDIDPNKLEQVIKGTGKRHEALSIELGFSNAWLRVCMKNKRMNMANARYFCMSVGCTLEDITPDPEPVKEEPKSTEYPIMPTITAQEFESLKLQLNRIERLQAEIVNAINAIGGADEVVERMLQKVKPVDEVNCENMLTRMFKEAGKETIEYAQYYNNCKSKWDVPLKTINKAIDNLGYEIVSNPKGKGRVIRKESKYD